MLQLEEKTAVLQRDDFEHGDENWLVLRDRIGTADWEVDARIQWFAELLSSLWQPGWHAKLVLFLRYMHDPLTQHAQNVVRLRHYACRDKKCHEARFGERACLARTGQVPPT